MKSEPSQWRCICDVSLAAAGVGIGKKRRIGGVVILVNYVNYLNCVNCLTIRIIKHCNITIFGYLNI